MANSLEQVRSEIENLHDFFCGWFAASVPVTELDKQFLPRFSKDITLIPPAGIKLYLDDLINLMRGGYGSNSNFRIQIRNVTIRYESDNCILATYEEWQRNALASKPADNGRISTVMFVKEKSGLIWLHVHENWLPDDVVAAERFEF